MDSATGASKPQLRDIGDEALDMSLQDEVDAYEDAWWRDGFGEDTRNEWFAASRTPRASRPDGMAMLGHRIGTVYEHTQTGARVRASHPTMTPSAPVCVCS